jgi:hypothetical protein
MDPNPTITRREKMTRQTLSTAAITAIVLLSTPVIAQDLDQMRGQIEAYTLKLADLEKDDTEQDTLKEIKLTELWISEAQAQIAKEEEDVAARYLRRAKVSIEMITLLVDSAKAQKVAYDRESAAIAMEKEAGESQVLLTQKETQKKKLNQEIGELRKALGHPVGGSK